MSQATIVLEDMIKTAYLRNDWCYWSSPSAAAKISTLSALALRICTLDAAIIYEKTVPSQDPSEICKSSRESPSNSSLANLRPSSARLRKALNSDPADCSKLKSRSSKRRKDSGGWNLVDMLHCEKWKSDEILNCSTSSRMRLLYAGMWDLTRTRLHLTPKWNWAQCRS